MAVSARSRTPPARRRALALALVTMSAVAVASSATTAAPVAPERAHYVAYLHGSLATPLWWAPVGGADVDGTTRFDVGPLPTGVAVRVTARVESPAATVHLYAYAHGAAAVAPPLVADPLPAREKGVTVAGPGTFVVLVDPGPSALYRVRVDFEGFHGDAATGSPAKFPLTVLGTYRCPLGVPSACPP